MVLANPCEKCKSRKKRECIKQFQQFKKGEFIGCPIDGSKFLIRYDY